MATLYIIRGIPGSGKSTLARKLKEDAWLEERHLAIFETDEYWYRPDGVYDFNAKLIKRAHEWCRNSVLRQMMNDTARKTIPPTLDMAVANTFTRYWEYEPYVKMAEEYGYDVEIIVCDGEYENIHGVPKETVEKMRKRFED